MSPSLFDRDIRQSLRHDHLKHYYEDECARVVEELDVMAGDSLARVDISIINGQLLGFEIKSDRDNLDRLPNQVKVYSRVFDLVTIIAGPKHVCKLDSIVPEYFGIMVAERDLVKGMSLTIERPARLNPEQDAYAVASLLWTNEAKSILQQYGFKGLSKLRSWELSRKIAESLTLAEVSACVRAALKKRPADWKP